MNTQKKIQHSLNDLIEIARDGHDFYTEAAGKVKDAELSALFMRIAGVKQDIVPRLSTVVASAGGKPAEHGTMVGSMQQFYGKVRAAFGDTNYGYVAELEESEDRLLGAFKDVLQDNYQVIKEMTEEEVNISIKLLKDLIDYQLAMLDAHPVQG